MLLYQNIQKERKNKKLYYGNRNFLTIVRQKCKLIPVNNPSSRAAEGFGPMKLRQPPNGKVLIPTGHAAWQMSVQTKVSVICIDGAFLLLVDGEVNRRDAQ
mgnify:FL=1